MSKREIKFRAWTQGNDPLFYSKTPRMLSNDELSSIGGYYYTFGVDREEGYTLMQYTGLKDRNGVEIYEGDVVTNNNHTWEITWKEGCVYLQNTKDNGEWWIGTENQHCEIIGNIYENPELIN